MFRQIFIIIIMYSMIHENVYLKIKNFLLSEIA